MGSAAFCSYRGQLPLARPTCGALANFPGRKASVDSSAYVVISRAGRCRRSEFDSPRSAFPPTAADFRTIQDGPPSTQSGRSRQPPTWGAPVRDQCPKAIRARGPHMPIAIRPYRHHFTSCRRLPTGAGTLTHGSQFGGPWYGETASPRRHPESFGGCDTQEARLSAVRERQPAPRNKGSRYGRVPHLPVGSSL